MDMFRIPKYAAGAYKSQSDIEPYLEVASSLNIGDFPNNSILEVLVLTNTEYIKFFINNHLVGRFLPSKDYEYLPHPPVVIKDFIGGMIHDNEKYDIKIKDKIKEVLVSMKKAGGNVPLDSKLKSYISDEELNSMYRKYISVIGKESTSYRFEGYINNKLVLIKGVGASNKNDLYIEQDDKILKETNTFETTRIVVKHLNEYLNTLTYSNELINVNVLILTGTIIFIYYWLGGLASQKGTNDEI